MIAGISVADVRLNVMKKSSPKESESRTKPSNTMAQPMYTITMHTMVRRNGALLNSVKKDSFSSSLFLFEDTWEKINAL